MPGKALESLEREWDAVAELRYRQIASGEDLSYHHVLVPTLLRLAKDCDKSQVLDAGCGVGFLTKEIARISGYVTGIDMSAASIAIARRHRATTTNFSFVLARIEDYRLERSATLCVSNMTLMSIIRLDAALTSLHDNLVTGGQLVFTTTHPCFWPRYCEYDDEAWFAYDRETVIEWPYHTSCMVESGPSVTHVHRSLEQYWHELKSAGFEPEEIAEPLPPAEVTPLYPRPWRFPRFLAARCRRL